MSVTFTVPGNPVGYYAQGKRPNWKRLTAYVDYKRTVQRCALAAGLSLPLEATKDRPLIIDVEPYFASGRHADPENVRKGVTDALFYAGRKGKKGSADKHTGGSFPPPRYDKLRPRVEVTVRELHQSVDAQGSGHPPVHPGSCASATMKGRG